MQSPSLVHGFTFYLFPSCQNRLAVSTGTGKGCKNYAYYKCQTMLSQEAKACSLPRRARRYYAVTILFPKLS